MNYRRDTLVILTPGFPESEADTTCLPPQQVFVRALSRTHPDLSIIILSFQYPFVKKEYAWYGTHVMSFGGKEKGGFSRLWLWGKLRKKMKHLHGETNIIGMLSFWCGECALVGKRFANKYHIPHYSWILGQDAKKDNRYIKWLRPKSNELIALSDFIRNEFEKNHTIRPQHLIPPGIDASLFDQPPHQRDIDVLAVGSFIPLKQYAIFIEVIAALKKDFPAIKAVLAGKGPQEKELHQLIVAGDLQDNIRLTGELPHKEVLQLMQRAKLFLHPSSYEGFGVVCIEALYAGASVISFCQPMKESINNWHIAASKEQMITMAKEMLQSPLLLSLNCPYPIENTVDEFMKLFGNSKVKIKN